MMLYSRGYQEDHWINKWINKYIFFSKFLFDCGYTSIISVTNRWQRPCVSNDSPCMAWHISILGRTQCSYSNSMPSFIIKHPNIAVTLVCNYLLGPHANMALCICGIYATCQAESCWYIDINCGLARTLFLLHCLFFTRESDGAANYVCGDKTGTAEESRSNMSVWSSRARWTNRTVAAGKTVQVNSMLLMNIRVNFCCNDQIDPLTVGNCEGAWYCARFT